MQIRNINSQNFTGCIAKASSMDGVSYGVMEHFKRHLSIHPEILDLAEKLEVDIAMYNRSTYNNPFLYVNILDRKSRRTFEASGISLRCADDKNQKLFFEKIEKCLNNIAAGKIKRPEYDKNLLTCKNLFGYATLDSNLYNKIKKLNKINKLQNLSQIYQDYFEQIDKEVILEV